MILRFTIIKGIGRFQDCLNLGGRSFDKNTIIFGQNAGGKSTLVDILWSLKTGDKTIIDGRRTFGYTGNQEVELFNETNHLYKFQSSEWSNGLDNIEIFDTRFINENIFEGNEISFGHQKNLNTIIIGPEGKRLANEISKLQEELNDLTSQKTAKTNDFNRSFKKEISIQDFKKLPIIDQPDEKIKEIQSSIDIANNQTKIKGLFDIIEAQFNSIINQNTKSVLSNSIEAKIEIVSNHILKNWKDPNHTKDFLQSGYHLTKEELENCVFCGQKLSEDAKVLISSYGKLFSKEYIKLQSEIADVVTKYAKWNPVSFIESIQDKLSSIKISLNIDSINLQELKEIKETVDNEFGIKLKDINYSVNFKHFDYLIDIFKNLLIQIKDLKKINLYTDFVNIEVLNRQIKNIEHSKIRYSKEWEDFIKEYEEIDVIQDTKKQRRERFREKLDEYSGNIYAIHLDTINKVLLEVNADFTICDFQPIRKLIGQSERIFALKFFNAHKVSIEEKSTNRPNFTNTLSESDKRVLAFAFFYSLMINDPKLNEKIIVFDDPFSSFDSDRRVKTVELLSNPHMITEHGELIEKSINQLIILTHETEFFKWIFLKLKSPKALKIVPNGHINGVKKSTFEDCNVLKEFIEDDNIKNLREIEDIFSSNKSISDFEGLCVKCRIIFETIFKRKYLFDLEDEINLRKSVRSYVNRLRDLKINEFDNTVKYGQFSNLCDNLNIELHDSGLRNEGGNSIIVLADFLKLIKLI